MSQRGSPKERSSAEATERSVARDGTVARTTGRFMMPPRRYGGCRARIASVIVVLPAPIAPVRSRPSGSREDSARWNMYSASVRMSL